MLASLREQRRFARLFMKLSNQATQGPQVGRRGPVPQSGMFRQQRNEARRGPPAHPDRRTRRHCMNSQTPTQGFNLSTPAGSKSELGTTVDCGSVAAVVHGGSAVERSRPYSDERCPEVRM